MIDDELLMIDVDLVKVIKESAKKAIVSLFSSYNETYYYCSLITDGFANCPIISAWSWEALEREVQKSDNVEEAKCHLKWSYADSPYCMYGNEYFSEIAEIFASRDSSLSTEDEEENEFYIRMNSMEKAMSELDEEGLFGTGKQRLGIVINVEIMPPDYSNTLRALRLNPRDALNEWLEEIAEEPENEKTEKLVNIVLIDSLPNGLKDLVKIKKTLSLNLMPKELLSIIHNIPVKLVTGIDESKAIDLIKELGLPNIFSLEPFEE